MQPSQLPIDVILGQRIVRDQEGRKNSHQAKSREDCYPESAHGVLADDLPALFQH